MNSGKSDNSTHSQRIVVSCYYKGNRDGEHFVPEHTLSYQIEGSLILNDGVNQYPSTTGGIRLIKRNQLLKFDKQPAADSAFRSLSLYLDQHTLKNFSVAYDMFAEQKEYATSVVDIKTTKPLEAYINSLLAYHEEGKAFGNQHLVNLKLNEGILLLVQSNPELKNILFDFAEPFKINLEAFMTRNFHFNVKLERFAYLTGRSLATFKRDFEKAFGSSPGQWIRQKRLEQAYYLITVKGKTASDVYLDLGFEDLSHFSFAFKKAFGAAPSKIK